MARQLNLTSLEMAKLELEYLRQRKLSEQQQAAKHTKAMLAIAKQMDGVRATITKYERRNSAK